MVVFDRYHGVSSMSRNGEDIDKEYLRSYFASDCGEHLKIPNAALAIHHWPTQAGDSTEECNPDLWNATCEEVVMSEKHIIFSLSMVRRKLLWVRNRFRRNCLLLVRSFIFNQTSCLDVIPIRHTQGKNLSGLT